MLSSTAFVYGFILAQMHGSFPWDSIDFEMSVCYDKQAQNDGSMQSHASGVANRETCNRSNLLQ
jgi:hypothetical protein